MRLVIEDEGGTRSIVPFAGDAIVIGRGGDDVTFRLQGRNVSRRHARFLRQAGVAFVEDLGSRNGTRVNGEKVAGKRRLREGDLVQIGDYDLAVVAEGAVVAPGAPPPLPAAPRGDPNAVTARLPALRDPPPAPPPAAEAEAAAEPPAPVQATAPAPAPAGTGTVRAGRPGLRVVAVVVALVAAAAALAWATGSFSPAPPSSVTRP